MKQEIRFCKSEDGTGIAYALSGTGAPLVRAQQWGDPPRARRTSPVWLPILTELNRRFRVARYDQRGVGLSDANPVTISFEAWVADLEAVVDAAGPERFTLLGASQGSAMAVAYAARHPERVSNLVILGGYARGWNRRGSPVEVWSGPRRSCASSSSAGAPRRDPSARCSPRASCPRPLSTSSAPSAT
jgi:pimeloyl-ACP methyl ester carboxylesterase